MGNDDKQWAVLSYNKVPNTVVVLDRVSDMPEPGYCIHGRGTCVSCMEWVWLGHNTYDAVYTGQAAPLCRPCALRHVDPTSKPLGNLNDHKRADGPHD